MKSDNTYIYGAARTPIGKVGGALSKVPATRLGAAAIREAVARSGVKPEAIGEVIMGNVVSAGLGQAPARQAAIHAGLPSKVGAITINKVCGSGLKAVMLADDAIRLGRADFIVAGGMENMSLAPHLLPNSRQGHKLGHIQVLDSLILDGLWDSFGQCHMGEIAEQLSQRYSRKAQDDYALESYRRAREAQENCRFSHEIVGIPIESKNGTVVIDKDEQPFANDLERLPNLPPAFKKDTGCITAGNASKINDGAAALIIGSEDPKLQPLARITGQATFSTDPVHFPVAPIEAITQLLKGWPARIEDIDLFEINEAFSVAMLAVCDALHLDREKVNVNGGAVGLGHPIGASGARLLVTLLYALQARNLKKGVAAICLGGGEAVALGIERVA
ncbi:Acetyl-CoA acetyltransferase [Nitrospina gracilis 3/211]|uniref:Acetyl-CoA acetyltransferase n=1 Tax=Nitrospina gracilis (strain 3/211) TaxID=1266370 RepID=M1YXN3_NITG3|nr:MULTISPECIES: thiolase family protein [Nitrospina]MCF8723391.1 acetyl-CoA C-acetyltransferase [Nitrospina sp. Nb-3]CCQ90449.1 Acetyl-CoA acetyltransferase [Nitrospina gracilis 3/211]